MFLFMVSQLHFFWHLQVEHFYSAASFSFTSRDVSIKHVSVDKLRNILEASAPVQGVGLSYMSWRGRGRICLSFLLWWFEPNARLCRLQSSSKVPTTPTFTCCLINYMFLYTPIFWSRRSVKWQISCLGYKKRETEKRRRDAFRRETSSHIPHQQKHMLTTVCPI